jgi:mannose-6-phosphate isomerase-like protein (cupin superfamily)
VRYCINETGAETERLDGDTVEIRRLFDDARGCEKFAQRLLRFGPGRARDRVETAADEVLYVLDGTATATIDGADLSVASGFGLFVGRGTPWAMRADRGLRVVSVLVHDPEPVPRGAHAVVDLSAEERGHATAARQFTLGVNPAVGCASVTQFIGFVPPGRAPDHFHRYDEVLYVLAGEGVLHIGEEPAPFGRGSCVHLPARLVHSLENSGDEELQLLGVFRPAGSPAEAYYPDGTPATYPEPAS